MRFVRPEVFLIGKTVVDKAAVRQWLDFIGADEYKIEDGVTSGEQLVQLAGKRCYMSFQSGLNPNVQRVRTDMEEFITNILKVGHGSVIEHSVYNFAIENVSRVFTGELNRHRVGVAVSEGSMRYIRFNDIPFVEVDSIQVTRADEFKRDIGMSIVEKTGTRKVIADTVRSIEAGYNRLLDIHRKALESTDKGSFKKKKILTSMMRRIIPMGVATGGVWSFNLRSLRHIFTMRCSSAAEEEIMYVACLLLEKMIETEPVFFKDFYKDEQGYWKPVYMKV
jgi:thymidylate synthase (FAD)